MGITRLKRAIRLGFKSLWLHRLRSLLTMLGMVFGVSSVIAMLAVGEGASFEAQQRIRQQGSHNIILTSVKPPEDDQGSQGRTRMIEYGLTYKDLQRIRATIPTIDVVVPGKIFRKKVWNVGYRTDCDIFGTVPWYPTMRNHPLKVGRFFTSEEMDSRAGVCVLGAELVNELFPREAALGKSIRIESDYYRVIGIMESLGMGLTDDGGKGARQESKHRVFIPMTRVTSQFGEIMVKRGSGSEEIERVELHELTVSVKDLAKVVETSRIIEDLLDLYHDKEDYEMKVPLSLLKDAEETARNFNIVLGAIAAISLLVGGIGIMNIMLASVTERTREIGIRRALGAKKRDIIVQFLVETVILAGTGGAIGVALGVAIPFFIEMLADMETIVRFWSPVLAFCISAMVGVVFGIYPALRAANMDPVEALRHE